MNDRLGSQLGDAKQIRTGVQTERSDIPLADILVVDLSHALAGPHAAMMLGDMGARVIKVERPGRGDESREWGPPFVGPEGSLESTYFLACNRNKESVLLDLKAEGDRAVLERLIHRADVLVINFRPGVLDRVGLDPNRIRVINPGLIVLSITGFGHDGPDSERAGYDQIAQAEAGLMSLTGPGPDQPTKVGVPIADLLAGMYGAYGVLAALHRRGRTGLGCVVHTSLLAAVIGVHAYHGTAWTVAREVPRAAGNHHGSIAPYGMFRCSDGAIQIAVGSESLWRRFAPLVGLDADDPRFASNGERVCNRGDLVATIEEVFSSQTVDHWLSRLSELGVPAGSVKTLDQVYSSEQVLSQGLLIDVNHLTLGSIQLPGPTVRFDDEPPRRHVAPPTLGQHDMAIRTWIDACDQSSPVG